MTSDIFKKLYESSKLLAGSSRNDELPVLQRGLDQLSAETQRLTGRNKSDHQQKANAHYFLAQSGINSQDFTLQLENLNTAKIFEPIRTLNDTDIEKYLEQEHERKIIETIEECDAQNDKDLNDEEDIFMRTQISNIRRQILEEWDHHPQTTLMERDAHFVGLASKLTVSNEQVKQRIQHYAEVVTKLNDARLKHETLPLAEQFKKLCTPNMEGKNPSTGAWDLVQEFAKDVQNRENKPFQVETYLETSFDYTANPKVRRKLIQSTQQWLEKQFTNYVDDMLLKHAKETKVGGVPSPTHRLRAFMEFAFRKQAGWTDPRFEVVNETPIWVYVYLLLRGGHADLALKYVTENQHLFVAEPRFVEYFKEYLTNPNRELTREQRDLILADYQRLEFGQQVVDPYKLVLYKIIGRCAISQGLPDVIATTEDYIWLQLSILYEPLDDEEYSYERYSLAEVQQKILKHGSKRFDPSGTNPWGYFTVLIQTLQFERAISYLYKNDKSRLDAVHFAIMLYYSGLLRVPPECMTSTDLLNFEYDGRTTLDFARLIHQYIRVFEPQDNVQNALQYIYLLTLNHESALDDMTTLCRSYIRDLVLSSKKINEILGTVSADKGRQPGLLDRYKQLIGTKSESDYIQTILIPAAEKLTQEARYADAVRVYELTADFNMVVDILSTQLGDVLQHPITPAGESIPDGTMEESLMRCALDTLQKYENQQHINDLIAEPKKQTIRTLIQLLESRQLYLKGMYEQALYLIYQSGVIPMQDDFRHLQQAVDHFDQLPEVISKNVPELLLSVTDILYRGWKQSITPQMTVLPASRQNFDAIEERIHAVLHFAGLIQFKIPADTMTKLNKAAMSMSEERGRVAMS